jgi:YfiH family protein
VARVRAGDPVDAVARVQADGLCTDDAGVTVGVFVADCLPVLLADPRTGACAAVHAGWRGTVAGVVPAAVRALADGFGVRPSELRVAIGPAIGPCCFEVGPEVVAALAAALADVPRSNGPGAAAEPEVVHATPRAASDRWHVDLKQATRLLLLGAGVLAAAIDLAPECTRCAPDRFFSFRRDGAHTGQQMGAIGRRA